MNTKWKSYEEVANYLLNQFKEHFGLEDIESKQKVVGLRSGVEWEIDAKGWKDKNNELFVVVECRRHTSSGQKQEHLAGLVYRIIDTKADSGIIVSPLPLQRGAKKVAQAEGIIEVTLNKNCTTTDYIMQFLNKVMIGISDEVTLGDKMRVIVTDANGNVKSDNNI
ncbi:MAG: restriction endonuclease [Candidatus Marinimicrobia bacterium]|nr:restriction endonuclease [Candidatus Neomarinimicrobiota bacterium]